jgi:hypothetical protein
MIFQGVEKEHILITDRYTFGKHSELLRNRGIKGSHTGYKNCLRFPSIVDSVEGCFAKIPITKDETAALNRNNFSLLATALVPPGKLPLPR